MGFFFVRRGKKYMSLRNLIAVINDLFFSDYPRVTVGPENPIRVERDDTAELFCEVDSKPKVHEVRWVRDGRFVQTNFRHLIPRANLKDAGPYICSADNGLGQVRLLSSN